ncbi:MAG: zf-HC2 domain-containing protein [Acidobacteriaceae bacterium]|nr:zf-HC2 domain-containing protein [Acidobacteriaceae bacterium]
MTCWSIKRRSTDYVDGRLRGNDRSRVASHLAECDSCTLLVEELASVRSTLRELPQPTAPSPLRTELLILASRERKLFRSSRLHRLWTRWKFRFHELMRPLTIPATGGLLSSLILFGALALTVSTSTNAVGYEVPVVYADKADANLVPVELRSAVVLNLTLDGKGRITDYAVQDGSASFVGDPSRLQSNNIALPEFRTVLAMTQPVSGDISISFTPLLFRP